MKSILLGYTVHIFTKTPVFLLIFT